MRILVLSYQHGLLPLAWRLVREGHEVEVRVNKKRFDRCWAGKLPRFAGVDGPELAGAVAAATRDDGLVVLTDSTHWQRTLAEAGAVGVFGMVERERPKLPALGAAVGGWWTGSDWLHPHLWLEEQGAWPGGLGANVPGAGMAVHLNHWPEAFETLMVEAQDELKSEGFAGLVQIWVTPRESGGWDRVGLGAGWPMLHTQAFVSELESFGGVLGGVGSPVRHRYISVLPLSVPPWPTVCNVPSGEQEVGGLDRGDLGNVFFHDVVVGDGEIRIAGTDGLVGVVRGVSNYPSQARSRATSLAAKVVLAEKQFRPDGGLLAERFLFALEGATGTS